ncbi:restriction endonuclease subunit S [Aeromonas sp. 1HA1]|nr:restriction endonuclease subunit S [Aeromonas sp. 1HA1]
MASDFFTTTIGEQLTLQRGFDITKKEQMAGDVPVVSSGGISSYHNLAKATAPGVVLGRKGSLGTVYFLKEDYWPHDTSLWVKDFKGNNPHFVYYFFKGMASELKKMDVGAANPALNRNHVHLLKTKWPSIYIQNKIAEIASSLDDKITHNRQINQTLEQMAQALFKSWFVDFDPVVDNALDAGFFEQDLAFPDELLRRAEARRAVREHGDFKPLPDATRQLFPAAFEECAEPSLGLGGWVPQGWKYQNFGQLLSMSIGGDWGKDSPDESHSVQSRIVRGTDIPDLMSGQLSKAPLRWVEPKKLKLRQIEAGDIIIEVSGGSPTQSTGRSIFMSDLMLQRLGEVVEPASFCRRFKPKSINHGLLGFLHLQKIYADGKMWEYQNQSTGIANFQTKFFLEAEPVLIPSNDLLDEFCKRVKPLVDKSHSNEQIVLTNLRDTLLPKLISGELRLDHIEAELAKVEVA